MDRPIPLTPHRSVLVRTEGLIRHPLRPKAHECPGFWGLLSTPDLSAGSRNMDDGNNMSRSTTPKSFVAETHTSPKSMNHKEEDDGNSHSHN